MANPLAYPLCRQTVTVYRPGLRRVLEGCFYRYEDALTEGELGPRLERKFLLIRPGAADIRPGDRVYDGVGPENVDWERFIPVQEAGLSQVEYATPWRLDGEITHWEAGRK